MLTYSKAKKMLGNRESKKVANNTYLERRDEKTIALRFYDTDVLTFTPMYIELNSGGFHTMSTTNRMSYGPVDVGPAYRRGRGWAVWLRIDIPCYYCKGTKIREEYTNFDADNLPVEYRLTPKDAARVGDYFADEYGVVYRLAPCTFCNKEGLIDSHDRESGGHPFYDGIRVNSTGRRLMAAQPNKPAMKDYEPIFTLSGWTGKPRSHWGFANDRKVIA